MKHGWIFMEVLTRAIEAWSDAVRRQHPLAFIYRGADLRHAVERDMFFNLANDEILIVWFDSVTDGERAPLPPLTNLYRKSIVPFMQPDAGLAPAAANPNIALLPRVRGELGNLRRAFRRPFRAERLLASADFLFLAIHPKFVTFMAPIAQVLGKDAAFLTIANPALDGFIAAQGLPAVCVQPAFSREFIPRGVLGNYRHFGSQLESLLAMMDALKPKVIVVPEGNAPIYEVANQAGKLRNVATVCLQHGAHGYSNPGFRNWTFSDFLVWGSSFAKPFIHYNPTQHFTVTGTPAELPLPHTASMDPIRSIGFFLQKGATLIPQIEWEEMLRLISWTAETFPAIDVIVRDHPTTAHVTPQERAMLGGHPNIRFMPPPHHSLNAALSASDVVVSPASTTLLEAVASGAIPFIFGTSYPKDFPDIAGQAAAMRAPNLPAAKTAVAALVADSGLRARLRAEGCRMLPDLFAARGAAGAQRIAAALRAAAL